MYAKDYLFKKNLKNILIKNINLVSLPGKTKRLLFSNFLYNFEFQILPIVINYAIWKNYDDIKFNIFYYLGFFAAHPIGYLINGILLSKFPINKLYIAGMLMEMSILISLLLFKIPNIEILLSIGIFMGLSTSMYWSNRLFMVLNLTDNKKRDAYLSFETISSLIAGIVSPLVFGFFTGIKGFSILKLNVGISLSQSIYFLVIYLIILITISGISINKHKYVGPKISKVLYFRFYPMWYNQRILSLIEGIISGGLLMMPSLVIFELIKNPGTLGLLESTGMMLAIVPVFLIGRKTKPGLRTSVISLAGILALIDALILAIFYNKFSAIVFLLGIKILLPIFNMTMMAVRMRSVELASRNEQRSRFPYFIDIEFFFNTGRMISLSIFFILYSIVNQSVALRYSFLFITALPFIYVVVSKKIPQND